MKKRRVSLSEDTVVIGTSISMVLEPTICGPISHLKLEMASGESAFLDCNRPHGAEQLRKKKSFSSGQFQRFWSMTGWPGEIVSIKEHVVGQRLPHVWPRS